MQQPNVLFKVDLQGPSIGVIVAHKHFAPLSQLEKYGVSVRVHFGQTQVGGNDGLFVQADGRSKAALDGRAVDKMQKVVVLSGVLTRRGSQIISIRGDEAAAAAAAVVVKYVMAELKEREKKELLRIGAFKRCCENGWLPCQNLK